MPPRCLRAPRPLPCLHLSCHVASLPQILDIKQGFDFCYEPATTSAAASLPPAHAPVLSSPNQWPEGEVRRGQRAACGCIRASRAASCRRQPPCRTPYPRGGRQPAGGGGLTVAQPISSLLPVSLAAGGWRPGT